MSAPAAAVDRAEVAQVMLQDETGITGPPAGTAQEKHAGHAMSANGHDATADHGAIHNGVEKEGLASGSHDDLQVEHEMPTEEELQTLRRVSGKIKWAAFTIAFCEAAERFSYYGSTILYTNFIQWPLPPGSNTGAGKEGQSGALNMGQQASTGLVLFNQFFAYIMPLFGAYIADAKLGRYKTIHIAIAASFVAHLILVAAAAPTVIVNQSSSLAAFIIGLLCLGVGTGFFKSNISPMIAEQNHDRSMHIKTLASGERVIVDPAVTNTRIYLYFYLAINIGSVTGQISMVWVEKYVGFWLAFLLPTALFVLCPIVLFVSKKHYVLTPPTGSVFSKFIHMMRWIMHGQWSLNVSKMRRNFSWDRARPSHVPVEERPGWMTYDDEWVDEVRRGLKACKVFLFMPFWWLAYLQITGNLTSQAATMQLNGVPNDIIQNLNPIAIIIIIPLMDFVVYPFLRKIGIHFTPIKRMAFGFMFSCASMVYAAVTQYYIYKLSPCGDQTTIQGCEAPINVWVQSVPYILIGISEIFTNTTSLEYAYSKAPPNMRSLVMSINLLMTAFAAALGQAFTPISIDPWLIWNYTTIACIAFVSGIAFWFCFRHLDKEEDHWNNLARSKYIGKQRPNAGGVVGPEDDAQAVAAKQA